jgi:UDP-2-acetamido-2,6-beta-L-arabino-hexul-4-ose reductase
VVYANSIQSGNGTPYGSGKQEAARLLGDACTRVGGSFVDVLLPNIFGEHGRPAYNSFVATFVDAVVRGVEPEVADREVALLHVQGAAAALLDGLTTPETTLAPSATPTTVGTVLAALQEFHLLYSTGDIPALDTPLRVDLFNTYRAARFPEHYPISLTAHSDERGRLVETVRAHGGQGQTFVSTTKPGVTRGEHFHLQKVERFVVLSGEARISLRRVFTDEVVSFEVTGDRPSVVDMPTMWVHNITNVGQTELTTLFWTHSLFDPEHPDTYWEPVGG